ncbi:MAG: hypothetical protein ACXW2T_09655 [Allosphingosinicella sp.]
MDGFTLDQWLVLLLAFLLGLFLGMAALAGNKWKRRYREEVRRREALETENRQLRTDVGQRDTLHRPVPGDIDRPQTLADGDRRSDDRRLDDRRSDEPRSDDRPL